jgi:hypothetical protein
MIRNIEKTVWAITFILTLSIINSCNLDDIPVSLRPGYEYTQIKRLVLPGTSNIYAGNFHALAFHRINYNDSIITYSYGASISDEFIESKDINAGTVTIAGVKLEPDSINNYFAYSSSLSSKDSIPYFGADSSWGITGSSYIETFKTNFYIPQPIKMKIPVVSTDSINRHSDLTLSWNPDPNYHGKVGILLEYDHFFNGDLPNAPESKLQWHVLVDDNGSFTIPKDKMFELLPAGVIIEISIARGTDKLMLSESGRQFYFYAYCLSNAFIRLRD